MNILTKIAYYNDIGRVYPEELADCKRAIELLNKTDLEDLDEIDVDEFSHNIKQRIMCAVVNRNKAVVNHTIYRLIKYSTVKKIVRFCSVLCTRCHREYSTGAFLNHPVDLSVDYKHVDKLIVQNLSGNAEDPHTYELPRCCTDPHLAPIISHETKGEPHSIYSIYLGKRIMITAKPDDNGDYHVEPIWHHDEGTADGYRSMSLDDISRGLEKYVSCSK